MSRPIWKNNKKLSNRNWIIVVPHPCVRKQPSFSCLPLTSSRINLQNPQFRKNFQYKPWRNLYPGRYVKYTERTSIKPSNSAHACGKKHTRVFLDCTTTEYLNRKKKSYSYLRLLQNAGARKGPFRKCMYVNTFFLACNEG